MTKQEFKELTENKIVYLDGAMGSNLFKRGMPQGVCPEQWMIENKDVVIGLQREYVEAGTNILYAPTFTANRPKLEEYGLADRLVEINKGLVAVTKKAAGDKVLVAGDITMTGIQLKPMGPMDFEELVTIYKEQATALVEGGVDLFVIETMMSLQETRAAVIAIKEICDLPILATMTFEKDGRSLFGTDARTAAIVLSTLGVDAVGANCSTGPEHMAAVIAAMTSVTDIPIIAKPNAGIPRLNEAGETIYDNTPENFAKEVELLVKAGATILGGCCGTSPEYIDALHKCGYEPAAKPQLPKMHYLTSERQTLCFGLEDAFFVIGERINPTGKKKLQEELRAGNMERVFSFAEEQEENGAKVLDVNFGMSGIDEKEMMCRAIDKLQEVTNLPLCIDTSHVDVMEAALRRYPGRALINSISMEKEKVDKLLPIAKKYGAMFILLPLSDKGLPESPDEKIGLIEELLTRATALGFTKEDIVVDGLVTTVGANKNAGVETLETIRYCKENGLATTCGLSNISFGLPERSYINAAFLAMMIEAGLTMAIANPNQMLLMNTALSCNMLLNRKDADITYIEHMNRLQEEGLLTQPQAVVKKSEVSSVEAKEQSDLPEHLTKLKTALLKGKRDQIATITRECLEKGEEASYLLNQILIPGINEVGDLFEKGKYFLPQLIASAETMKESIEILEPILQSGNDGRVMPTIVIATVAGDIHDIGKNLVALMLKNYGFRVIDLGKDVKREVIIDTAIKEQAQIIALSALMTTTMKEMNEVVKLAKEKNVKAKIIIGGAVITQEYCDEIGADGYSKDAAEAVKCAERLLGLCV